MIPISEFDPSSSQAVDILSSEFGILLLIGICILEGMMLLYFLPSELIVPASLFVFGSGLIESVVIVTTVSFLTTVGQTALFHVSKSRGRGFITTNSYFRISEERINKYEKWFNDKGQAVVPITNSLPFVRGTMTIPAGLSDMSYKRFFILSLIGSILFEAMLAMLYVTGSDIII